MWVVADDGVDVLEAPIDLHLPLDPVILISHPLWPRLAKAFGMLQLRTPAPPPPQKKKKTDLQFREGAKSLRA